MATVGLLVTGCAGETKRVSVPGPTMTATVTQTVTATPTATATVTVVPSEEPEVEPSSAVEPSPDVGRADEGSDSSFDRAWAVAKAEDIVEDITMVDERMGDGIGVSSALRLLAGSYGRLGEAGQPPGTGSNYMARVQTLEGFARDAAEMYYDDPMNASAKYQVTRRETGVLFSQLNKAIGTNFRLP